MILPLLALRLLPFPFFPPFPFPFPLPLLAFWPVLDFLWEERKGSGLIRPVEELLPDFLGKLKCRWIPW